MGPIGGLVLQVGGTNRGPGRSAWWLCLPRGHAFWASPGLSSLPHPLGFSMPLLPTCATGAGRCVPDLPPGCGHPPLPLCPFPLPLPASGLLLPWLLAEPVGRRPHCGRATDAGSHAGLGIRAPGLPPRYPLLAFLTLCPLSPT